MNKSQFMKNEDMGKYVDFICSLIKLEGGAEIENTSGMRMGGAWIPVKIEIIEQMERSAEFRLTALGHSVKFIFYMSRKKGPEELIGKMQRLIDENVSIIINQNGLDRDDIFKTHHPLRKLKLPFL